LAEDFPGLPGYAWTAVRRRLDLAQYLVETGRAREGQRACAGAAPRLEQLAAPERREALKARGHLHASSGGWSKDAADLTRAIELGSVDMLGVWCPLALVQLGAGRTDEYRALCEKMLERSEDYLIVGICGLAPEAVADLTRPVRIAERLVARGPENAGYLAS